MEHVRTGFQGSMIFHTPGRPRVGESYQFRVCQLANLRVKLGADGTELCSCSETLEFEFGCETVNFEIRPAGKLRIS
jgi:hypothetical protein